MISLFSRWLGLIGLCLLSTAALAQLDLKLDTTGLDEPQQAFSQQLIKRTLATLPTSLRQRLDRSVSIRWVKNLPSSVIGRTAGPYRIELNAHYLPSQITAADPQRTFRHGSLEQELVATLLHELLHLYDRSAWVGSEQRALLGHCSAQHKSLGNIGLPSFCRGQQARRFSLSDDPRFLDLAGWHQEPGQRGAREQDNGQIKRSPDPYELTNPREYAAVNFEYFLLDPSYACRRPSLARYLSQHFAWQPESAHCATDYAYLNAGFDPQQPPLAALDPERVYQVHYLLAEANDQWVSRWGHSMLRLVVCAPETPKGPDCLLDLHEHLVLSYRAYVGDLQLSSWDGLVGAYPSRLFILPLNQVIDEYTKVELRALSSTPLQLSEDELAGLLERTFEQHWSYDGDYYFLSNNCAVETLKLLRTGSARGDLQDLDSITPTGLLELLEARNIANPSPLQNRDAAIRQGYLFDSYQERYEQLFKVLRERLPIAATSLQAWLALEASERQPWIQQSDLRASAALLILEQAALRRQLLLAQEELKQRFLSRSADSTLEPGSAAQQLLQNSGFLSQPAELLGPDSGYGLPQQAERQQLNRISQQRHAQLSALTETLDSELLALLSPMRRTQIEQGQANLNSLGEHLRQLHQQSGGLQLP